MYSTKRRNDETMAAIQQARESKEKAEHEARNILHEIRRRRDPYTDSVDKTAVKDPKLESLRRQCDLRLSSAVVLNKGHDARCNFLQRQVDAAMKIYDRKATAMINEKRKVLREHVGRKIVLDEIEKSNCSFMPTVSHVTSSADTLTLNPSSPEMHELIEQKIKENSPAARRRRMCQQLLRTQKQKEVGRADSSRMLQWCSMDIRKSAILERPTQSDQTMILNRPPPKKILNRSTQHDQTKILTRLLQYDQTKILNRFPQNYQTTSLGRLPQYDQTKILNRLPQNDHPKFLNRSTENDQTNIPNPLPQNDRPKIVTQSPQNDQTKILNPLPKNDRTKILNRSPQNDRTIILNRLLHYDRTKILNRPSQKKSMNQSPQYNHNRILNRPTQNDQRRYNAKNDTRDSNDRHYYVQ